MKVELTLPDELLIAIKEDKKVFKEKALIYVLGKLYESGKISGGLGARALGCSKAEFYRILSENSFNIIDYPDDELQEESTSSKMLAEKINKK